MRLLKNAGFIALVLTGLALLTGSLLRPDRSVSRRPVVPAAITVDESTVAARLDEVIRAGYAEGHLHAAPPADDLILLRRLTLALAGTVPSLAEIRDLESSTAADPLAAAAAALLTTRRCSDYLAERFARSYVGTEDGPFLLYRRRRFTSWLSDALATNRPYDQITRDLIAESGLWTDHPATNFISVTIDPTAERPDPDRLASRVSRAFLGTRIDCAQCHDHPFEPWTQDDFRGLSAMFSDVRANLGGVRDVEADAGSVAGGAEARPPAAPAVPYAPELLPSTGTHRERLAAWVVHPENHKFAQATVNRVWALLLGRPLVEPVDDLPADGVVPPALELLAHDFTQNGHDLKRLIRVIVASETFRRSSAVSDDTGADPSDLVAWNRFPVTPLRPEQVGGAVQQVGSLATIDTTSAWLVRLATYTGRRDFVNRYGDTGEDVFDVHTGTIPQRLLLMNGQLVQDRTENGLFNASSRIAMQAPSDAQAVEVAFLTVLTRRPTPEERDHFIPRLGGTTGDARQERLGDLFWALLNTTEFSWNH